MFCEFSPYGVMDKLLSYRLQTVVIIIIINAVDPNGVSYRRQDKGVYIYNSEGLN